MRRGAALSTDHHLLVTIGSGGGGGCRPDLVNQTHCEEELGTSGTVLGQCGFRLKPPGEFFMGPGGGQVMLMLRAFILIYFSIINLCKRNVHVSEFTRDFNFLHPIFKMVKYSAKQHKTSDEEKKIFFFL